MHWSKYSEPLFKRWKCLKAAPKLRFHPAWALNELVKIKISKVPVIANSLYGHGVWSVADYENVIWLNGESCNQIRVAFNILAAALTLYSFNSAQKSNKLEAMLDYLWNNSPYVEFFEWPVLDSSFKDTVDVFGWGCWHFSGLAAHFSCDLAAQDYVVIFNRTAVWSVFIRCLSLLGNKHICSPSLQGHSASLNWVELSCIGFRSHWRLEFILFFFLLRAQKSFPFVNKQL